MNEHTLYRVFHINGVTLYRLSVNWWECSPNYNNNNNFCNVNNNGNANNNNANNSNGLAPE